MSRKTKLILGAIALAVVGMLFVFSREPGGPDTRETCTAAGIDPETMAEGTCYVGETKQVVVDLGHPLKLESLDARLLGARVTQRLTGPGGTKRAKGRFVTFDLALTNRTDAPVVFGENQAVLLVRRYNGEDVEAEEGFAPDSLYSQGRSIEPGETVHGSLTFQVPPGEAKLVDREGNLDFGNFGSGGGGGDFEPEALFQEPEVGVIRTYRKPKPG
jgi:hypothetical protein